MSHSALCHIRHYVAFGPMSFSYVSFGILSFGVISFGVMSFGVMSFGLLSVYLLCRSMSTYWSTYAGNRKNWTDLSGSQSC